MIGLEKDILILIARVRCITETQVGKLLGTKKSYVRRPFKKTLKKMCNEYTLRKYPCNINYPGYKENSYVYYLNGSPIYKGKDLTKVVVGSELVIRLENNGYKIRRLYRNPKIDGSNFDLFIEYTDRYNDVKQILVDIDIDLDLDKGFNMSKYENIEKKIEKSTIPFFEVPKVIIVTLDNTDNILSSRYNVDINFVDINFTKLFRYI